MKKIFIFIWEIVKIVALAALIVIPIRYFLFQPFFVRGQSMEPSFEHGDYLIVDQITYRFRDPQRGETIVFKYPLDSSQRFIKRVIGLSGETVEIKDGKVIIYTAQYQNLNNEETESGFWILNESNYLLPDLQTPGDIKIILGEDEYFVLGDNRAFSFDSRRFGVLPRSEIIGRVFFRAWPIVAFAKIEAPEY